MTVSTTLSRNAHVGNASTTTFPFAFGLAAATDLVVTRFGPSDPATGTVLVKDTDYTLDSYGPTGGEITTTSFTAAADETVEIRRETAQVQLVDLVQNDTFDAEVAEDALDALTYMIQDVNTKTSLNISVTGAAAEDTVYLIPPPEDGKLVVGNAADGWENKTLAELGSGSATLPLSVANGGTGAATAALARDNLGLGDVSVLDTGTGAGDVPTNGDLGSASLLDAGTGADEVVQLDGSGRLPAVPARNLKELRGMQLLAEDLVADYTGAVSAYTHASLGTFDQLLVELIGVGVDTDLAEVVLELSTGATLYGDGGTTGKFDFYGYWSRPTANTVTTLLGANSVNVGPLDWLWDSGTGGHESCFSTGVLINNFDTSWASGVRRYPVIQSLWGFGIYSSAPGTLRPMTLVSGSGYLLVDTVVDGVKLRTTAGNFNGGLIRVWGLSGGLWSSGFERPFA